MKNCKLLSLTVAIALSLIACQSATPTPTPTPPPAPAPQPPTPPAPDTTPPSVSSFTAVGGSSAATALEITASDALGVERVEFWRAAPSKAAAPGIAPQRLSADQLVFTATTAPYRLEFTPQDNGSSRFYAKVFDVSGNATTSDPLDVTVNVTDTAAPSVPTMSLNKTYFLSGESLVAQVGNVQDNFGIVKAELVLVNGETQTLLQEDFTAPYELTETIICTDEAAVAPAATRTESKTLRVVVYDAAGNSSASATQTVTVECAPRAVVVK